MDSFIAYALIGSALDELVANPALLKHAAADPDAELLDYLEKHAAELKAEVDGYCLAWLAGFRQKLAEAGLEKTALFGLEQTNPKLNTALEVARFGGYFVPGVGTGIMGAEALGNFADMLSGGKSWGQRLGAGAAGLMNTGLAGLSLIPGGGFVGAALKSPRLLKMLKLFGPKAAPAASAVGSKLLGWSQAPIKKMLGAAESGQGLLGKGMRFAGFNPAYKPWIGKQNPFQMLQQVSENMRAAQLGRAPLRRVGMTSYVGAGMPAGRRMLAALPLQMAAGSVAAGPARVSQPLPWDNFGSRERWWATHPGAPEAVATRQHPELAQYQQALLKAMNN